MTRAAIILAAALLLAGLYWLGTRHNDAQDARDTIGGMEDAQDALDDVDGSGAAEWLRERFGGQGDRAP